MPITFVVITGIIIISIIIGLDIWFVLDKVPGNTWSSLIRKLSIITPVIPWVCGVLSGHFFHWWKNVPSFELWKIILLLVLTAIVALLGLGTTLLDKQLDFYLFPLLFFFLAFIAGSFLWPV
jgi:uncharacterized membrane protein YoaK (UPF0700 family)